MRPLRPRSGALALALAVALPVAVGAQGTVSAQGFGYPPGQLSTLARSTGGALADFDAGSPVNPAALGTIPATSLFVHYAPESRSVRFGGARDESRVERFPVVGAAVTVGPRGVIGLGASTLLDRSWATVTDVDGTNDGTGIVESFQSRGAINDVRLAGAYSFGRTINVGIGAHVYTGANRLTATRVDQSGGDATVQQSSDIGYSGSAASLGVLWTPVRQLSVAASGQVGGTLRASVGDSTIGRGTAPARASGALRFHGITGVAIAARAVWEGWSSLDAMGSEALVADDALELGLGADIVGPSIAGRALALRVGVRQRDLPFAVLGEQPRERAVTGGLGLGMAGGRAVLDFAIERASRTAGAASETGWVFAVGATVRP